MSIVITPPFWKTWWFVTLSTISCIMAIGLFVKYRLQRINEHQLQLEKQVKERTQEITFKNTALEEQANNLLIANNAICDKEQKLEYLYTEISNSIRAAEVIQKSILPSEENISTHFRLSIKGKINNYTNHEVDLQKGDVIYLFSDGYADQIGGGEECQKFSYPQFRQLLISIGHMEMNKQKERLEAAFKKWKGDLEQLDDIIVIGIKI